MSSNKEKKEETIVEKIKKGTKRSSSTSKLKKENAELKDKCDELQDKYLRLFAEFDNYKKRTMKEKIDLMATAARDTVHALLPVLDDFDRAKINAEGKDSKEHFSEGVSLVYQKLYNTLNQRGLEPMVSTGEVFDPEFHEAITEIPAPAEDMKGKVVDTIEKGYKLKDTIIRHAKVVVGK
ncbi:MAG: nucleotide exchange factor GrpE [Bacteroidia bacterium]|nr:nucleotide exchange factor GrpE [Bacteroidia bacterium]